jgi:hypothetical protein
MAKKKGVQLSPAAVTANTEGEARRQASRDSRQANADKQKRFRESMKADGYKQTLTWDIPCPAAVKVGMTAAGFRQVAAWEKPLPSYERKKGLPAGVVKVAVPLRQSSLGIADKKPEIVEAVRVALWGLQDAKKIPKEVYKDILGMLVPLGGSE